MLYFDCDASDDDEEADDDADDDDMVQEQRRERENVCECVYWISFFAVIKMIAAAVAEIPVPVPHLTPDAEAGAKASRKSDCLCAGTAEARACRAILPAQNRIS